MAIKFPVHSIAKPFLAQAVLELALSLGDIIGQHVTGFSEIYAHCRIDKLLNHSSGLADYSQLDAYQVAVDRREKA